MKVTLTPEGAVWSLDQPTNDWLASLPLNVAAELVDLIGDEAADATESMLTLTAAQLASLTEPVAMVLGLPPRLPLGFDLRLAGSMGRPDARLGVRWLQPGKTIPAKDCVIDGCTAIWLGKQYRVASPSFDVLSLVAQFNAASGGGLDEQFRHWSHIRHTLGETQSNDLTDSFLRSFRVVTASAFTFAITTDATGNIQLDPMLLIDKLDGAEEQSTSVRALTEADERQFPIRLDQLPRGACAFPLNRGTYVVVDRALQQALAAVRDLRGGPAAQRKHAAMHPQAVLREILGEADDVPSVFVETEKFAERVQDIAPWSAPVVPWIKIVPQSWGVPNEIGVRLDGVEIPIAPSDLDQACMDMRVAVDAGKPSIKIGATELPASKANLAALERLQKAASEQLQKKVGEAPDETAVRNILVIETNFVDAAYNRVQVGRRAGTPRLPHGMRTNPKPHQELGLAWLQQHWISGSKGAMLCDDMGLGKTFQALAFCLWVREMMTQGQVEQRPILLVAPVGLLRNWDREITEHLHEPGLGNIVNAFGEHLRALKRGAHRDGTAGLDTNRLSSADVVLANYEAVSDYQLSFGAVQFAVVVFDEAQKVKSPSARMTHSVKALNADFLVAMTGTPVENRLADLWCIADTVQPGGLSNLKDFSSRYERDDSDVTALRDLIWQQETDIDKPPKLLLRRLKSDALEGLPSKHDHVLRVKMPARQLEAYGRALAAKELSGPQGTLGMIHALRRISLHPSLFESAGSHGVDLDPGNSARMIATMQVLDEIAAKGEKALVFLESLDLQEANQLPLLLQRRFQLKRPPMVINGEVSTAVRQDRVERFQAEKGFDVMLLSPKAGGVGLTLTAANHVVHLSRWWNPAVEDQCSDRVYRIGQTLPVHVYYPLAVLPDAEEQSFDIQLQMLMDRKRELARNLLAAPAFTKADYAQLVAGMTGH